MIRITHKMMNEWAETGMDYSRTSKRDLNEQKLVRLAFERNAARMGYLIPIW